MGKYRDSSSNISLFGALIRAKRRYGGKTIAIVDADDRELSYIEIVRASFALGSALKRHSEAGEKIGVMMPTGAGGVLAFFALQAYGRIPAMLNFSAGLFNMRAAIKIAELKTVITARRFVKLGGLEDLIAELEKDVEILYLEDLRDTIGRKDKLMAALGSVLPGLVAANPNYRDPSVILFTSGTEGDPKGVALSHKNLVANCEQVRAYITELEPQDVIFNPLPIFHCFGLTGGTLLPLFMGYKVGLYPTPLHVKIIPQRIKEIGATIAFATDTFLSRYARAGSSDALSGLRFCVCGAEQVRDETRAFVKKKYDLMVLEGYGATEAAPVIAVNKPSENRYGTVGHFLPGMEHKLEDVPGINRGGLLYIKGPNVMIGYMRIDNPGVVDRLDGDWHDTGDIVDIDEDGFVSIRGRVKRFANIGGETVSLAVVENCAKAVWPDNEHVALLIPDEKKGEQIVVLSDSQQANRNEIRAWAQNHGVPELAVPKKVYIVEEIPLLGTGKVDYTGAQKMLEKLLES